MSSDTPAPNILFIPAHDAGSGLVGGYNPDLKIPVTAFWSLTIPRRIPLLILIGPQSRAEEDGTDDNRRHGAQKKISLREVMEQQF